MHQSSAELFQEYLDLYGFTPKKFSKISGMPQAEVIGILEGRLPITTLRANHLAAAFKTKPTIWTGNGSISKKESMPATER
jgi:plasmid maintenance system antidote protein VapI